MRRSTSLLRGLCRPWRGDDSSAAAAAVDAEEPPPLASDASVASFVLVSMLLSVALDGDTALLLAPAAVELSGALVLVTICSMPGKQQTAFAAAHHI